VQEARNKQSILQALCPQAPEHSEVSTECDWLACWMRAGLQSIGCGC